MSKLKIYRASAGSGKTYTITREFVLLLFAQPYDYKHLLAVTFTNKATAEMKSRIVQTIYALWQEEHPDYLDILIAQEGSEAQVRSKAGFILNLLLHDFSRFTVSTIDSFFQRIIRSFLQELGLHSGFKTELDNEKILNLAVDRLVMQLGQPNRKELRDWLISFSHENMDSGNNWNIAMEMRKLGKEVNAEAFQSFHSTFIEKLSNKTLLDEYKKELQQIVNSFESAIKLYGEKGLKMMKSCNVTWDDFYRKSTTPFKLIQKMADLSKGFDDTSKIEPLLNDTDSWPQNKKDAHQKDKHANLLQAGFGQLLNEAVLAINENKELYNTAILILKNFNSLAIINDIASEMDKICTNESLFLLSNSNRLLHKIIDGNDVPFVYEKSGSTYKHFMIDEFQDTSSLQWLNFKPLIDNSLASNNMAMIVGDVKQSIYRWRNSDWKLLANKVQDDFDILGTELNTLETNWRSTRTVIEFNNIVFESAAQLLQQAFNEEFTQNITNKSNLHERQILDAYFDIKQLVAPKNDMSEGFAQLKFIENQDSDLYKEESIKEAVKTVELILSKGFNYKDICILVRKTSEAQLLTNALLSGQYSKNPYPVVSNEALMLSGSLAVAMVVNQLKMLINPQNEVYRAFIYQYHNTLEAIELPDKLFANIDDKINFDFANLLPLKGLPLMDLVETLIQQLPKARFENESVFIQAFIDSVAGFVQNNSADLAKFLDWWDEEGYKKSVSVPEDQDAIRVMTIHKSKGLEFEHVILPFLNWELNDSKHRSFIWCEDPFVKLEKIPVPYSKNMLNTVFSDYYFNELLHQYVDNLNMIYVAFTRAKLSIWGICPLPKKEENLTNTSDLLFNISNNVQFGEIAKWESNVLTIGDIANIKINAVHALTPGDNKTGAFQTIALPLMQTWPYSERIQIFMESANLVDDKISNQINHGKVLHRLFELIKTPHDVENAVNKLVIEGLINPDDSSELQKQVFKLIHQKRVSNWFSNNALIYNETSIISKNKTLRPDRVIVEDNRAIVVDYKFGELHIPEHFVQIRKYMKELHEMGHSHVEGYIWYVTENDIYTVTMDAQLNLFS